MPPDYDFDISLSFAGEHRPYVTEVASGLRQRGFNVFYDQFSRAEILGQDLINFLQDVYSRRSAVVAAFISEQWVSRPWPTHERQTVLARALLDAQAADLPFLLPFRFDDTPVPGLQPSVAYEDLRELYPGERPRGIAPPATSISTACCSTSSSSTCEPWVGLGVSSAENA